MMMMVMIEMMNRKPLEAGSDALDFCDDESDSRDCGPQCGAENHDDDDDYHDDGGDIHGDGGDNRDDAGDNHGDGSDSENCVPVEAGGDGVEPLLAGCVPNLQLHHLSFYIVHLVRVLTTYKICVLNFQHKSKVFLIAQYLLLVEIGHICQSFAFDYKSTSSLTKETVKN